MTGGTAGVALALSYGVVDLLRAGEWAWAGFRYMGMNAIVMYLLAEGGIVEYIVRAFYWGDPVRAATAAVVSVCVSVCVCVCVCV